MRGGINHIDKLDFLAAYTNARVEAFKPQNIQNSFAAAGLAPYNPQQVLDKLNIQLKTPTPPGSRPGSQSSQISHFTPEAPQNFIQLQQQASSIKAFLKRRSKSPPSPTNQALNQLVKGCEITMNSAIFLAHENGQLRAANEKQKQKCTQSNRRIPNEGGMTVQECQKAIEPPVEAVEPPRSPLARPPTGPILPPPPVRRKLPKCNNRSDSDSTSDPELDSEDSDDEDEPDISNDEGQLPREHYLAQAESLDVSQLRQQRYSDVTQERLDETRMYWNR
ncbi:hypothetical protein SI65_07018 [Aspergillus cristatus]|uniref:Uncharacterized protein n=1 Tax=Aspergillus cristatus TaxID=573508 RepID=A0A1E3B8P2_ASPCR|nr:hypothetical protein SI65_07018 [Aspergillus cristatus]